MFLMQESWAPFSEDLTSFVYDKEKNRLVDAEAGITITSKATGVGLEWRCAFEFSGGGVVFCFFAKPIDTRGSQAKMSDHWSLDGTPRKSYASLIEIDVDKDKLAWAFKYIVQALPLFPAWGIRGDRQTLDIVKFDLFGDRTPNPTL